MTLAKFNLSAEVKAILSTLGVAADRYTGGTLAVRSPITGEEIGRLNEDSPEAARAAIEAAHAAFLQWRLVPAPKRGELIRLLGEELRAAKAALGRLVSIEVGKIVSEGRLVRLGCGVYGLAFTSGLSDRPMLFHPHGFIGAARTALTKLGVAWEPTERELAYQEGRTTEISAVPAVRIRRRFSRRLSFGLTELVVER